MNEGELLFQPAGGLFLAGLSVRVHLRGHQHEQAAGGVGVGDGDGDGVDPHLSHVFLQRSLMRGLLHPYFCFHRGQTKIEDVKC